jgi:phage tail sheath protein FI
MQTTYPGVYILEPPSGVHTIIGVATSIAAFVGYTLSGPDNRAVELFSWADFERNFGGLAADSELSYAVQQFFANGGTDCFVVRIPKDGATAATITIPEAGAPATAAMTLQALSKGRWASNIAMTIDYIGLAATDPNAFNLTVTNLNTGVSESFPNVTTDPGLANFVTAVVNDPDHGSQMITVPQAMASPPAPAPPPSTPPVNKAAVARTGLISGSIDPVTALSTLQKGGDVGLTISVDSGAAIPVTLYTGNDASLTSLTQYSLLTQMSRALGTRVARALQSAYPGAQVTVTPVASALGGSPPDALSVQVQLPQAPAAIVSFGSPGSGVDAAAALMLDSASAINNVAAYWMGGTNVSTPFTVTVAQAKDGNGLPNSDDLIGDELQLSGIYALDKVSLFNILCIPDATRAKVGSPSVNDNNDSDINTIYTAGLDYCKKRRAFLLIDSPPDVADVAGALNWRTNRLTVTDPAGHAATYFPRLRIADPLNKNQLRSFASCGVVAGIYATEDGNRGVWKAPAGIETAMSGVQKLTYNLTDDEQGELNPIALNCFRVFPIYGPVVWGARTLVGADAAASQWKYIPVRRFASFIEESLYRGLQWVVFEPNAEPLWAQIRLNVGSFMQGLFLQNAFQGQIPKDAYFVLCDATTTTQGDIDAGIVNIIVGFAPLKPAEFVVLKLEQMAGQLAA